MNQRFQCYQCYGWFDSMWGDTCNTCRDANQKHKELIKAMAVSPEAELAKWKAKADFYQNLARIGTQTKEVEIFHISSRNMVLEKQLQELKNIQRKSISFYIKKALRIRIATWIQNRRDRKEFYDRLRYY